jgi:hypothetical protein
MTPTLEEFFYSKPDPDNNFYPPASSEEIAAVENRLNIQFSEDYRAFLKSSNGFEGFLNEFLAQLLPVERIEEETTWIAKSFPWAICIGNNGRRKFCDRQAYVATGIRIAS